MTTRALSQLSRIVVHHSASPRETTTAALIDGWHRAREWDGIGYHYVIEADGRIVPGRPLDVVGAHVAGQNQLSVGICVVGDNTRSGEEWSGPQSRALGVLVTALDNVLGRPLMVVRHCDLAATQCPGLSDAKWFDLLRTMRGTTEET